MNVYEPDFLRSCLRMLTPAGALNPTAGVNSDEQLGPRKPCEPGSKRDYADHYSIVSAYVVKRYGFKQGVSTSVVGVRETIAVSIGYAKDQPVSPRIAFKR